MADNVVESALAIKLTGDAAKTQSFIERLGATLKKALGQDAAKAIDQTTEAIKKQEKQVDSLTERYEKQKKALDQAGTGFSGDVASASGGLRGAVSTFTGGADPVSKLLETAEALGDIGEFAPQAVAQLQSLVSALGAGGLLAAGAAAVALVALGAAIAEFTRQQEEQADAINAIIDARREVNQKINEGLTTEDAIAELDKLKQARADEQKLLDDLNTQYQGNIESAGALAPVLKAVAGSEEALSSQIGQSKDAVKEYDSTIAELEKRLQDGSLAANDAAKAEEDLAKKRVDATLKAADVAGKEESARRRAMDASVEQNESRLNSIEDERAAIEAQIAVLQSSGVTSEEVTAKLAELNGQLGSLGKEAEFIKSTALAAAKQREAEKKAADDAKKAAEEAQRKQEQAQEKAYQANVKYQDALVEIAKNAADAAQDAARNLHETLADNQTSFTRDMQKLDIDAQTARRETQIAFQEEEARTLREHQRTLESIREQAVLDEADALRKGDFLAATLIRERATREMEQENETARTQSSERQIALQEQNAAELRELMDARNERRRALQEQNADARLAYARELADAREARSRAARDAAAARNRELQDAARLAQGIVDIRSKTAQAEIGIMQQVLQFASGKGAPSPAPQFQGLGSSSMGGRGPTNITNGTVNTTINTNNPREVERVVMTTLGKVGLVK